MKPQAPFRQPTGIHGLLTTRRLRLFTCFVIAAAGMAGSAQASPVTVDGTFLSFTSFIGTGLPSLVNATPLTAGTQISPSRYLSNTVFFPVPTTAVTFNYDPTCCGFIPPRPYVNSFEFIAAPPADVNVGDTFQLGTFRFTNGQWWEQADIGFRLTSHSADAALDGHVFEGTLRLISVSAGATFTDPTADALAESDFFYILGRPDLGSARVFDLYRQPPGNPGYAGSFALDGRIGSLIPTEWRSLGPAGFTNPSVEPPLSDPAAPVPEPASLILLGTGLGVIARAASRRKRLRP